MVSDNIPRRRNREYSRDYQEEELRTLSTSLSIIDRLDGYQSQRDVNDRYTCGCWSRLRRTTHD